MASLFFVSACAPNCWNVPHSVASDVVRRRRYADTSPSSTEMPVPVALARASAPLSNQHSQSSSGFRLHQMSDNNDVLRQLLNVE